MTHFTVGQRVYLKHVSSLKGVIVRRVGSLIASLDSHSYLMEVRWEGSRGSGDTWEYNLCAIEPSMVNGVEDVNK